MFFIRLGHTPARAAPARRTRYREAKWTHQILHMRSCTSLWAQTRIWRSNVGQNGWTQWISIRWQRQTLKPKHPTHDFFESQQKQSRECSRKFAQNTQESAISGAKATLPDEAYRCAGELTPRWSTRRKSHDHLSSHHNKTSRFRLKFQANALQLVMHTAGSFWTQKIRSAWHKT